MLYLIPSVDHPQSVDSGLDNLAVNATNGRNLRRYSNNNFSGDVHGVVPTIAAEASRQVLVLPLKARSTYGDSVGNFRFCHVLIEHHVALSHVYTTGISFGTSVFLSAKSTSVMLVCTYSLARSTARPALMHSLVFSSSSA